MSQIVTSPEKMEALGASIIQYLTQIESSYVKPFVIFLRGELGSGKTTLVRGALRASGYTGLVKSPTFTLVETYSIPPKEVYHFDLYRISDPEELDYIGIREFNSQHAICFIEWPDQGKSMLPEPTIEILIEYCDQGRQITITSETLELDQLTDIFT